MKQLVRASLADPLVVWTGLAQRKATTMFLPKRGISLYLATSQAPPRTKGWLGIYGRFVLETM